MNYRICVFCGSSEGKDKKYKKFAEDLGLHIAKNKFDLVYGGASIGLMGAVADAVLENQGQVYGVMPKSLADLELSHTGLTSLRVVNSMHDRKQKMYDLSDVFVAIPGGMGTMDEFCEIFTWSQIKYHDKPCYIFNFDGYFDSFITFVNNMHGEGFIKKEHMEIFNVVNNFDEFFDSIGKALL